VTFETEGVRRMGERERIRRQVEVANARRV